MKKKLIRPTPTPSTFRNNAYDRAADSVYFLETILACLGIDREGKPIDKHAFTRKFMSHP